MKIRLIETIMQLEELHKSLDTIYKEYDLVNNRIVYSFLFDDDNYSFNINQDLVCNNHLWCECLKIANSKYMIEQVDLEYFQKIVNELYKICSKKGLV